MLLNSNIVTARLQNHLCVRAQVQGCMCHVQEHVSKKATQDNFQYCSSGTTQLF